MNAHAFRATAPISGGDGYKYDWKVSGEGHHLETPDGYCGVIRPEGDCFVWGVTPPSGKPHSGTSLDWPMARAAVEWTIEELRHG